MYASKQFFSDENKPMDIKEGAAKGVSKHPTQNGNNRRALADVGNLVNVFSVRCNTNKEAIHKENARPPICPAECRITRTQSANFNGLGKPILQREQEVNVIKPPPLPPLARSQTSSAETIAAVSGPVQSHFRLKETLTALLTSTSEAAAIGYSDAEMYDADEDFVPDIDEDDVGNPLAVVDYVEDIYCFYRRAEALNRVTSDYMSIQEDINGKMRAILIDWLIEVHYKFKLMPETLFLTINVIDRFLSCQKVYRTHLQLVGVTAMLIAAKYEEVWAPEVQDFVYITNKAYTHEEILYMEKEMLNRLNFNLTVPTPYVFLVRFLKAAASEAQMDAMAFFFAELSLVEYSMVKYPPSLIAAAAVYAAQCTVTVDDEELCCCWSRALERHSGYSERQVNECAKMMVSFHVRSCDETSSSNNLRAVHRKYASPKRSSVSLLCPATSLLS